MHTLTVHNFGPLSECSVEVHPFLTFIGPQSSGKSILSKLIFYFLLVRDEVTSFVLEAVENKNDKLDLRDLSKRLRKRFLEFWGPTPQLEDLHIRYEYMPYIFADISLDDRQHRYITVKLSKELIARMKDVQAELARTYDIPGSQVSLFTTVDSIATDRMRERVISVVKQKCDDLFGFSKQLLFIPAGRSLLSTLSDQLQYIHPYLLDYPMRQFIEKINTTKAFFGKSLEEIIRERQAFTTSPIWFSTVRRVQALVKRILKGEYVHDREGGKLFINSNTYTKINYASSGQQESIWILLSLFVASLDRTDAIIFIEEPEAHLFPDAQKDIVELIAFIHNTIKSDFVITTHSPYILSAINNLIYAYQVGSFMEQNVKEIINKNLWLNPMEIGGYFIRDGRLEQLLSTDLCMLKSELVDSASVEINEEYDRIFALDKGRVGSC